MNNHDRPWRLGLAMMVAVMGLCGAQEMPVLRLNDIQMLGSHNSYRRPSPPAIAAWIDRGRPGTAHALAYEHPPLARQLDLGVRQLEIDTFADPAGNRFADPAGARIAPGGYDRSIMSRPGFKVMHIPGIDYRTHCATLIVCLKQVRTWSRAHPDHLPIVVTIDAKDQPFADRRAVVPVRLTKPLLSALDQEIRSVFPPSSLITPDTVRGHYPTLRDAVLADRWPTLRSARGKIMLIFDVRRETAELYRSGHPSLAGRAMFSLYAEDQAEAATMIVQDPRGSEAAITRLVRQGFLVRTRSDADTREARASDHAKADAAIGSGAQIISTDYYPGAPDPEHLRFTVALPGGGTIRCNPVRQPASCKVASE